MWGQMAQRGMTLHDITWRRRPRAPPPERSKAHCASVMIMANRLVSRTGRAVMATVSLVEHQVHTSHQECRLSSHLQFSPEDAPVATPPGLNRPTELSLPCVYHHQHGIELGE